MSGHSKWSTIHRQKEAQDIKRGKLFSKLSRAITLAARQGGAEPEINLKLRFAIEKARQANMPKENIKRALQHAEGKLEGRGLEEVKYEGYGPEGLAVIVEAVTDNKNRTAQEIKNIFERAGGTLGGPGSVSFQFTSYGLLLIKKGKDPQEDMLTLIDLGVEDVEETEDGIEVYVAPSQVDKIKQKLEEAGFTVAQTDLVARPKSLISIAEEKKAKKALSFLETLNGHEDVQSVFVNLDIPNQVLSAL